MALTPPSQVRDVTGLTADELTRIRAFLQGAVYCWYTGRPGDWFSLRDLMGGPNRNWQGTPLFALYQKHDPAPDAEERAGHDGGWLLKRVITDDPRTFETRESEQIRQYRWIQAPAGTPHDAESGAAPHGGGR
jgi:hypothetical protein